LSTCPFLSKYDPDPLRYYLTATAPETRGTEYALRYRRVSWEDFVERNNHVLSAHEGNELVATHSLRSLRHYSGQAVHAWGMRSVANRMLAFAYKRFDGRVLTSGELSSRQDGERVRVAGWAVVRQCPPTAKGHLFVTLEDEEGSVNLIVRPDVYGRHRDVLRNAPLLWVEGRPQREGPALSVLVYRAGVVG
jgi:DNA polymerase III alpha subunit